MTNKHKLCLLVFSCISVFLMAQESNYTYKRGIEGVSTTWHNILLPDAMIGKLNSELSDLRIYGITKASDTIEAPYFIDVLSEKIDRTTLKFKTINTSKTSAGYFYTFKTVKQGLIQHIDLEFKTPNYDWLTTLEGSNNQSHWFTILEDYRIVSITNESVNYSFSKLKFKPATYRYYRLLVKSKADPNLKSARLNTNNSIAGEYSKLPIQNTQIKTDKKTKTTQVTLHFLEPYALSRLDINIDKTYEYYRHFKVDYVSDSLKTEKGWHYYYKTLTSGTLSAFEAHSFNFKSTVCKTLRLTIYNTDNAPLKLDTIAAFGYKHRLNARFINDASYYLVYGNSRARKPSYDIINFKKSIPDSLAFLNLKPEEIIAKKNGIITDKTELFDGYWLWGILGITVILLAVFTLKMIKTV